MPDENEKKLFDINVLIAVPVLVLAEDEDEAKQLAYYAYEAGELEMNCQEYEKAEIVNSFKPEPDDSDLTVWCDDPDNGVMQAELREFMPELEASDAEV